MIAGEASSFSETLPSRLPARVVYGWGLGSFAASTMYQVTTVLLLRYLVDYVGLAAATAGALIGMTKLYDAVADPFIGAISDRTRSPWGRRRPYILFGGMISATTFACLFSLPHLHDGAMRSLVATGVLIANTTGYALLSIPHLAMPGEMTRDFHERTYLMSFRVGGLALAQLSGTVLGPYIIFIYGGGAHGHSMMGVLLGCLVLVASAASFFATRGAPATEVGRAPASSMLHKLKLAAGNRPFVSLILCKLANLTGVSWYFVLLPFIFTTLTHAGYARMGLYFLFQGGAMLCAQPFLIKISRVIGKKGLFYLSSCGYGLVVATWALAGPGEPAFWSILRALAIGVLGGGTLLAATSLLPDAIEHDFERTGLRREGIFAGIYTTIEKVAAALAASLVGFALSLGGYIQNAHGAAIQPPSALLVVRWSTLAPTAFCILSAVILSTYALPDREARQLPGRGAARRRWRAA